MDRKVRCDLCQRSEETKTTGNLLTEDEVTAHYNCMLYSAGLISQDSPQYGDLGGFRAEDVKQEVVRGKRLVCCRCKRKVATVGCEVQQCKKSYHYPCAIEDGAKCIDDDHKGIYVIYCLKHCPQSSNGSVTKDSSQTSRPLTKGQPAKRAQGLTDVGLGDPPAKRRTEGHSPSAAFAAPSASVRRAVSCDSVSAGGGDTDMEMYAPLESDIEENENSEQHTVREIAEEPIMSPRGRQEDENTDENEEDDAEIYSQFPEVESQDNDDSQTLRLTVDVCLDTPSYSEYSQRSPGSPAPPAAHSEEATGSRAEDLRLVQSSGKEVISALPGAAFHKTERPCSSAMLRPASTPLCPPRPASPPTPSPGLGVDPASFWRSCNAAGCTQAIFHDFFNQMKDVADRIWSDNAGDEDYDLALSVLAVSGNLAAYVAKQQEELQRKQRELQKASAAMMDVVTALKKRLSAEKTPASL